MGRERCRGSGLLKVLPKAPRFPDHPRQHRVRQDRRKEKVDLAKPFHNILLLSIGTAFSLCLGEFAFRFYAPRLLTHDDFKRFSAAARQQGQSIGEYANALEQGEFAGDPEGRNLLGWSRKSNEYNSIIAMPPRAKPSARSCFSATP